MKIEFDPDKAAINLAKHGISFEEASTSLYDEQALAMEDVTSENEQRWILIGMSNQLRLLTMIYTLREPDIIRLISARRSTKREMSDYA